MDTLRDVLQQHAETVAQALRDAFPDVPLPIEAPIGYGYWVCHEDGTSVYHLNNDTATVEAFFRGLDLWSLPRDLTHFMLAPPPARRWTEVVGEPLRLCPGVTSSISFLSPQARAYYLPAYLLTILPLLTALRFDDSVDWGRVPAIEFVGWVIGILIPPTGLDVWKALSHLPPEALDPRNTDLRGLSEAERFLRFVGQFTRTQCHAIGRFVEYAFATYPFYVHPADSEDEAEMAALTACWLQAGV